MKEDYSLATPLFISMQDLSKDVNQMKKESQKEDPRRRFDEEGPRTSYQQKRRPEYHRSPHRYTMPTFLEEGESCRKEERREPENHETLSIYLEVYKAQSRSFKEILSLQEFFELKEERRSYNNNRRKRHNRFYFSTFYGSSSSTVKAWRKVLDTFSGYIL